MKASTKSLHSKLYQFTYTSALPNNLCPYFWKLVIATIIFIPNFICQLPPRTVNVFKKNEFDDDCNELRGIGIGMWIAILAIGCYLFATIEWAFAMFNKYSYIQGWANFGWSINAVIAIIIIIFFATKFYKDRKRGKHEEEKESIIVEFVKAKYNRYCPKIDWQE